MAGGNLLKADFSRGELSGQMEGSIDLNVFSEGSRVLENFFLTKTRGVRKREGFEFVVESIEHEALNVENPRLIPMVRAGEDFSLLLFGAETFGDNERDVVGFREYPVNHDGTITDIARPVQYMTSVPAPAPAVPVNLSCTVGNQFVLLSWDVVPGATDYDFRYRRSSEEAWIEEVGFGDLLQLTEQEFELVDAGEGIIQPSGLRDAEDPRRFRDSLRPEGEMLVPTTETGRVSVEIDGLTNDEPYEFEVRSRNSGGNSDWSDTAECAPTQIGPIFPDGWTLNVTAPASGGLRIEWDDVPGANRYRIRIRPRNEEGAWEERHRRQWQLGRLRVENRVLADVSYEVQVQAGNAELSAWSVSAFGTPVGGQAPGVPQNPMFEIIDPNTVEFTWDLVAGGTNIQYIAELAPENGDAVTMRAETNMVRFENLGTENNYSFRVRSVHGDQVSEWSRRVMVPLLPATPTITFARSDRGHNTVRWTKSPGATEYIVHGSWKNIVDQWSGGQEVYRGADLEAVHVDTNEYPRWPWVTRVDWVDWRFQVAAVSARGQSRFSDWVRAWP